MGGGGGGGDCCKQGFAAEGKERKGAVALSDRVLYTLTCAHTHSLFPLCLSPNVSVNQSVDYFCVCVCWGGDVEKSSKPSFISMTDGKFISFTLTVSPSDCHVSHVRPLSLLLFILLFSFMCMCVCVCLCVYVCVSLFFGLLFAVTLVQSQIEASMVPCQCLLSFTIHFEPQGAKLMSCAAEAPVKGGFLIRRSFLQ